MPIYLATFSDKSTIRRFSIRKYEFAYRTWDRDGKILSSGLGASVCLCEFYITQQMGKLQTDYRQEIVALKILPPSEEPQWRIKRINTDNGSSVFMKLGQKRHLRLYSKAEATRQAKWLSEQSDTRNGNFEFVATDEKDAEI